MGREKDKADHLARHPLVQEIPHGKEIAQRLGHLPPLDLQHLVVQPDPGKIAFGMGAAALGDLVFMMRKHQVVAAAVNVERRPEQRMRHRRAFDMPAGAAAAPGALPAGQIPGRGFPQHEIHRVALVRRHLDAGAGNHVIHRPAGERAVILVALDREQHMALGGIGMALGDQPFDHLDHLADILRRPRHLAGLQRAQRRHVVEIPLRGLGGDLLDTAAAFGGAGVDLVVDVGEVAHIGHMVRPIDMAQQPEEHVEHDHIARVPQVGAIINRWPAEINPHVFRIDRGKDLFSAGLGIVQSDLGHNLSSRARRRSRRA